MLIRIFISHRDWSQLGRCELKRYDTNGNLLTMGAKYRRENARDIWGNGWIEMPTLEA